MYLSVTKVQGYVLRVAIVGQLLIWVAACSVNAADSETTNPEDTRVETEQVTASLEDPPQTLSSSGTRRSSEMQARQNLINNVTDLPSALQAPRPTTGNEQSSSYTKSSLEDIKAQRGHVLVS